jgi:hypothetical protein
LWKYYTFIRLKARFYVIFLRPQVRLLKQNLGLALYSFLSLLFLMKTQTKSKYQETPASRLLVFILRKLEEEPLITRAQLCEDLSRFAPSEGIAQRLLDQAKDLRKIEGHSEALLRVFEPASHYGSDPGRRAAGDER